MNIFKGHLLEWLICNSSASPIMAVFWWKTQKSNSYSVHKAGYLSWSLVYIGILKEALMSVKECLSRMIDKFGINWGQTEKAKACFFFVLLYRLPPEGMVQILRVGLPTLNDPIKKILFLVCPAACVLVNSRCRQVKTKISHHTH